MKNEVDISEMMPIIGEALKDGKQVKFKIRGQSMYPTLIELRDSVILEKHDRYKKYDIVLYRRDDGHYVLHRIVGTKSGCFKLCGDNQTDIEYPIRKDQIIARAVSLERKGRKIDAADFKYGIAVHIWTDFLPFRRQLLKIALKIRKNNLKRK